MSNLKKLTAVHDGQTFTRTTHRTYTHVVIGRNKVPKWPGQVATGLWVAVAWVGRPDLIDAQINKALGFWLEVLAIEVTP